MKSYRLYIFLCTTLLTLSSAFSFSHAQCVANFDYSDYSGPLPVVGGITFDNLSDGPFADFSWDFGDGSFDSETTGSVTHFYEQSGTYEVTLTIWNNDPGECFDQYNQWVDVIVSEDPCEQVDCVWPGDTNADGKADLEDLINIGLGYGMTGPARDTTSVNWEAQLATDWEESNGLGVNYKHFDCNGDGTISLEDVAGIQHNYMMLENGISVTESSGIPISVSFNVDTVVITDPDQYLEVSAALKFGSLATPMNDVFGVVLYLTYPKNYVVEDNPVDFDYNEYSFFGNANEALPLSHNLQEQGQMDIVLARKNGLNASGQGRVATISFIIDSDIIDGRIINEGQDFPVNIKVVSAVDIDGNPLDISLPEEPTGVFFQNGIVTSTSSILKADQFKVNPNPVSDRLQIEVGDDIHPEFVEVFDLLGKRVLFNEIDQRSTNIDMSQLQKGLYIVRMQTEEGIGSKRVLKQ
jgi:PKD repeat protein